MVRIHSDSVRSIRVSHNGTESIVVRFGHELEFRGQGVVHDDGLTVAQFENPGAHDGFAVFNPERRR